jgi:hypothetical protein
MWDVEIAEVDGFIAAYKTLDGPMPAWVDHHRGRDWQLRWGIQDAHLIERGELCITCDDSLTHVAFVAIMNQRMFYRLDIAPLTEVHPNPYGAAALNLPPSVSGPHVHGWPENREYVRVNGFGQLPYRRGIQALVQTIADGLAWVAQDLNLMVTAEQRVCDPPIQTKLI